MNPAQPIEISKNPVGFCLYSNTEPEFFDDFQTPPRQPELLFTVHIGIAHGTSGNHAPFSPPGKGIPQQLRRVLLDFDVFKIVVDMVTGTAAVAVNTSVRTAAVKIYPVTR